MRAIYYPFEKHDVGDELNISGESAHHLFVVRVRPFEEVLVINGKGAILTAQITNLSKTHVQAKVVGSTTNQPKHSLSLAIAMPKKEAWEDILKFSVELGINEIFPLSSDFSQHEYEPSERVQRLLESALIQSNNPFFPVIHSQVKLKSFLNSHNEKIVFFNSLKSNQPTTSHLLEKKTILIGPEGGFSKSEVDLIREYSNLFEIHLPTPILRAPTAVASSVGYLLAWENNAK